MIKQKPKSASFKDKSSDFLQQTFKVAQDSKNQNEHLKTRINFLENQYKNAIKNQKQELQKIQQEQQAKQRVEQEKKFKQKLQQERQQELQRLQNNMLNQRQQHQNTQNYQNQRINMQSAHRHSQIKNDSKTRDQQLKEMMNSIQQQNWQKALKSKQEHQQILRQQKEQRLMQQSQIKNSYIQRINNKINFKDSQDAEIEKLKQKEIQLIQQLNQMTLSVGQNSVDK